MCCKCNSHIVRAELHFFQAALSGDVTESTSSSPAPAECTSDRTSPAPRSSHMTPNDSEEDSQSSSQFQPGQIPAELDGIAGTKCRVLFSQEWGEMSYQNAMIVSAEPIQPDGDLKVSDRASLS